MSEIEIGLQVAEDRGGLAHERTRIGTAVRLGIKAELTKVNQSMKNLLEAVKEGALSIGQIKQENVELQESK